MKLVIVSILVVFLFGCGTSNKSFVKDFVKFDETVHKDILKVSEVRIRYVSCDIGLMDGLGLASSVDFPITTADGVRAILQNPAISIALSEAKSIAKTTINPATKTAYWKPDEYAKCKLLGIDARVRVLSTVDVLKMFPQLAQYLAVAGL